MLEAVADLRRAAFLEDQFRVQQLAEFFVERCGIEHRDRLQQFVRELTAERRSQLRDFFRIAQPIESGHQQVLQRRRNRVARELAGQHILPGLFLEQSGFEQHVGAFFDEQRHAVGASGHLLGDFRRQCLRRRALLQHLADLSFVEPLQRHLRQPRVVPRRLELRPKREHQKQPLARSFGNQHAEQFQRRSVDPVQVLDDEQHGRDVGTPPQPIGQRVERFLFELLRRELQRGISRRQRQRDQRREQRHGFVERHSGLRQPLLQPCELRVGRLVAAEVKMTFQKLGGWVEAAVLML